ncbi:MAG: hypothetical protein SPI75_00395 [Sodaliphilus sp.]|nr:hypothetical protein [Sodaliphilus sp.]
MSEAKWSITEAKCLQMSHNKYASQRDAISYSMGYLMLSHSAGMQQPDISIAGICPNKFERAKGSKRFHFASLHYIFSAYLPTHIKSLWDFLQSSLNIQGQLVNHPLYLKDRIELLRERRSCDFFLLLRLFLFKLGVVLGGNLGEIVNFVG